MIVSMASVQNNALVIVDQLRRGLCNRSFVFWAGTEKGMRALYFHMVSINRCTDPFEQ